MLPPRGTRAPRPRTPSVASNQPPDLEIMPGEVIAYLHSLPAGHDMPTLAGASWRGRLKLAFPLAQEVIDEVYALRTRLEARLSAPISLVDVPALADARALIEALAWARCIVYLQAWVAARPQYHSSVYGPHRRVSAPAHAAVPSSAPKQNRKRKRPATKPNAQGEHTPPKPRSRRSRRRRSSSGNTEPRKATTFNNDLLIVEKGRVEPGNHEERTGEEGLVAPNIPSSAPCDNGTPVVLSRDQPPGPQQSDAVTLSTPLGEVATAHSDETPKDGTSAPPTPSRPRKRTAHDRTSNHPGRRKTRSTADTDGVAVVYLLQDLKRTLEMESKRTIPTAKVVPCLDQMLALISGDVLDMLHELKASLEVEGLRTVSTAKVAAQLVKIMEAVALRK